jgi:hypothetical protein
MRNVAKMLKRAEVDDNKVGKFKVNSRSQK